MQEWESALSFEQGRLEQVKEENRELKETILAARQTIEADRETIGALRHEIGSLKETANVQADEIKSLKETANIQASELWKAQDRINHLERELRGKRSLSLIGEAEARITAGAQGWADENKMPTREQQEVKAEEVHTTQWTVSELNHQTGAFDGALQGTLEGTLEGTHDRALQRTLDGPLQGALDRAVQGTYDGILQGNLEGTLQPVRQGDLEGGQLRRSEQFTLSSLYDATIPYPPPITRTLTTTPHNPQDNKAPITPQTDSADSLFYPLRITQPPALVVPVMHHTFQPGLTPRPFTTAQFKKEYEDAKRMEQARGRDSAWAHKYLIDQDFWGRQRVPTCEECWTMGKQCREYRQEVVSLPSRGNIGTACGACRVGRVACVPVGMPKTPREGVRKIEWK